MQHQDTLTGEEFVPSGLDTIFQQVVLIGVGVIGDLDGIAAIGIQRLEHIFCVFHGIGKIHPTHEVALIGSVACRSMGIVQIATVVHDGPIAHAITVAAVSGIEIGQAQTVSELVTEGTNAIDEGTVVIIALQLVKHGIAVDRHPVELEGTRHAAAPIIGLLHVPLAGPHALGDGVVGLSLAHTGIEYHDDIDHAVAIVVIL